MLTVHKDQIIACLQQLNLQPGAGLLIHSAIQYLGNPEGGIGIYLEAIAETINCELDVQQCPPFSRGVGGIPNDGFNVKTDPHMPTGTIAVPTFTFSFAHDHVYDQRKTPSQGMGAFSEYVRQFPGACRTLHPLQSVALLGRYSSDLADRETLSAFDPGSAFERMLDLDFKILLLGADVNAISLVHYSEQRAGVPYRFWKDFNGEIITPSGRENRTYRMFARDLDLDPRLDLVPIRQRLLAQGDWQETDLNYGMISLCSMADFVAAADELLKKDPWALVSNRP